MRGPLAPVVNICKEWAIAVFEWMRRDARSVTRGESGSNSGSRDEEGSAIAEFVLIATPLFIPALLFFLAMHSTATQEMNITHLARQAVRAFVTAESLQLGHQRVKFILDRYSELEFENSQSTSGKGHLRSESGQSESGQSASVQSTSESSQSKRHYGFTYNISCSAEKCLTPGSLVEIKLYREFQPSSGEVMTGESSQIENLEISTVWQERKVLAVARSYVDKWRSEE
jgi:hypothetical protein